MNNYEKMLDAARMRFLSYSIEQLRQQPGVADAGDILVIRFLDMEAKICKADGQIFLDGQRADFRQALTIYDYLCDGKPGARAAGEFCPVGILPGIFVGGSGLGLNGNALAEKIHRAPEAFRKACAAIGGREVALGDMGFEIPVFQGLTMMLKFYHADEEFPATMTLLWDRNILHFIRYETVYYLGGCVLGRLEGLMREFS